ncbi:hypothetical protein HJC23_010323 [Cyclotella cryptica]|uniref:RING-type domain-containing protein n=1 Tax=Cyclotella cryptica TaxID=29204 RepID=A0ABD3QP57_9STRA
MPEDTADCPLCLCPLEQYDICHPVQCSSRNCQFNFCLNCIESLIKSTKDECKASDENTFKVFLHCPNCRDDLSLSIRDTVLLRKVDKYRALKHLDGSDGKVIRDEELTASELRFKHGLEKDVSVASAIEAAQDREKAFFRNRSDANLQFLDLGLDSLGKKEELWSFDDEEGFEADIDGTPRSFVFKHHSLAHLEKEEDTEEDLTHVNPDKTLLCGLESFMTDQEKQYITYLLTSGCPNNLAAAAELLDRVAHLSRLGQQVCTKRKNSLRASKQIKRSMLESIRNIIQEGKEEQEKKVTNNRGQKFHQAGTRREQKMQSDLERKKEMIYMAMHPLPARMPKYAELVADSPESFALTLLDDKWDGSVQDAFSRITVNKGLLGKFHVKKHYSETPGIRKIIDACSAKHNGKGIIDIVRPRVIVASLTREAGMQGIVAGDVVSHINGDEFTGTADELRALIAGSEEGSLMTFAFNADKAVAEALRRRFLNFGG